MSLEKAARDAVAAFPGSDLEVAMEFFASTLPEFVGTSNDRLLKAGRCIRSLVELVDCSCTEDAIKTVSLEESLELLLEESKLLISGKIKVPKVSFGNRTSNLQMPIVTLGCMRFQEEWGPRIDKMNMVGTDCQDNLLQILKTAIIDYGINHIETARGYGCSELQIGCALKQLYLTKQTKREDLIIQSKIPPNKDIQAFENALKTSLKNLQTEYLDLFAFHGMNRPEQMDWVFGEGNDNATDECKHCLFVINKYKKMGKIKYIGFSTHGSTDLILECINKDCFDYVNLHYHYFGSYTASGGGHDGQGNLDCIKLAENKGMGIFVISPFDKGGRLYAPSRQLRSLTLPEHEPMSFQSHWLWSHHELHDNVPQIHTYTVGAGRPSDLDNPAVQAYLHGTQSAEMLKKTKAVMQRLDQAREQALGKIWPETWWKGLPKASESKYFVEHNQIVWIYNSIKAFGMYEFGKARYNSFEKNGEKWDDKLSPDENIDKMGRSGWGFVPGLPLRPGVDYEEDWKNVPAENLARVKEAHAFVYKYCRDPNIGKPEPKNAVAAFLRKNFSVSSQLFRLPSMSEDDKKKAAAAKADEEALVIPVAWKTSYDMRPWPDYPDQPQRNIEES
ncbi:hypothetical protein MPSEU_000109300 [Mayamaea pseudoterrestris]|nr:hypothetical protein MPSEU_000109300 [Mayamaea pseudoterrestris]